MIKEPLIVLGNEAVALHYCPQCHTLTRPSILSVRELEVLQLIAGGWAAKEIGRRLHISVQTIDSHVNRICQKANIDRSDPATNTIVRMVRWALKEGYA
jgi:DNA-binding NarL/FixJ family response regulator